MLANLISDAVRLAPRFANEDGELLFDHLTTKFPDAATDAVDLVVRRVCANATAGLTRDCWASLATSLLNEIEDWGDLSKPSPFGIDFGVDALDKLTIMK